MMLLGVDTGGTFTDFVLLQKGQLHIHKVLSTPHAPEQAILQGIHELGLPPAELNMVHGSTVATNALLERKGVSTVFITNHGLGDMLTLGRQARQELYQLQPRPQAPPVPEEYCLESGGRLSADGEVLEPLEAEQIQALLAAIQRLQPRAVAINLLFSFVNDRFERQLEAAMPAGLFVSRSSDILPEYKEYERGITTWLNAYVGPLVQDYLQRLQGRLVQGGLTIMQSSGGTMQVEQAGRRGVHMLLSGPAGGLQAASYLGGLAKCERLLTFDMGGTSTDVALIDGGLRLTNEGQIGGYPVAVPMVDMHTIGAGGGSIAALDAGGMLQVGPQSAGARPGPVCYGKGGDLPTVTDANLVLGRLRPDAFLGGGMKLDVEAARKAIGTLAQAMGCSVEAAAEGVIGLANEHMAAALRVISVQKGHDPRDFHLMCFGGAGGLHVCALAEAMDMRQAIVPVHGGVLSALGMLVAPRSREVSRTLGGLLQDYAQAELQRQLQALAAPAAAELRAEGVKTADINTRYSLDLRYQGQSYTLNIPWHDLPRAVADFHATHEVRYGHKLQQAVELVNIRARLQGPPAELQLPRLACGQAQAEHMVDLPDSGKTPVYLREKLGSGAQLSGPALIVEKVSTTWLAPGWRARVDRWGNLLLGR